MKPTGRNVLDILFFGGLFAATLVAAYFYDGRPFLGEFSAFRHYQDLIEEGDCDGARAELRDLAADEPGKVAYFRGKMAEGGICAARDIAKAVALYRESAAAGYCRANVRLGVVAIEHRGSMPDLVAPKNNFLVGALCQGSSRSFVAWDHYWGELDSEKANDIFWDGLWQLRELERAPIDVRRKLARRIAAGDGFDPNPVAIEKLLD